jgi:hypothetical protein
MRTTSCGSWREREKVPQKFGAKPGAGIEISRVARKPMAPMQIRRFSFAPVRLCCRVMVVGFELIGARFKMSALGAARSPVLANKEGVIIGKGRFHNSVRVQFDRNKSSTTLHRNYIEVIPTEPGLRP